MKIYRILLLTASICCLLFSVSIFNSCTEKDRIIPNPDSDTLIKPRGSKDILPDSFFQLHNDFILWTFDNFQDSIELYINEPADFADFTSRKWFQFTGEVVDIADEVLDKDEFILAKPYYIYNEGFSDENLIDAHFSSVELGYIYTVLDSIYESIGSDASQETIQNLICRGKSRISALSFDNEIGLINILSQTSYSIALAFEFDYLYGNGPGPVAHASWFWCFIYAYHSDVEAHALFEALDSDGGASGHLGAIVYMSLFNLATCWNE